MAIPTSRIWLGRALAAAGCGVIASALVAITVSRELGGGPVDVLVLAVFVSALYVPAALGVYAVLALLPWRSVRSAALPASAVFATGLVLWTGAASLAASFDVRTWSASGSAPSPARHSPVILVALDGADWDLLTAGIEAGELPTFAELVRRGARGELGTLVPTVSPAIWTTVATGYSPDRHGIWTFAWTSLRGSKLRFGDGRVAFPGQSLLLRAARRLGLTRRSALSSADRRAPTVWALASAAGERAAVVHWWATWPAEPLNGWLVTDRFFFHRDLVRGIPPDLHGLTHPPDLAGELSPFVLAPREVELGTLAELVNLPREELEAIRGGAGIGYRAHAVRSELPYWIALDRTYGDVAYRALETAPWDLFVVYLRGLDIASHAALRFDPRFDPDVAPDDVHRYGRAVRETYRRTDRWLAGLLARAPEDAIVLVLSDHGWRKASDGSPRTHHDDGPPGVLLAAGPTVTPGTLVDNATVYDVAPTLLHALGLPVPTELEGRVWTEIVGTDRPVARSATWVGPPETTSHAPAGSGAVDEELLRRLEALGYLTK